MDNLYDVIIVGAGPAGLSAAMYMARAKYKVLVLEKEKIGGQITITEEVVNYPGVFQTSGTALTGTMHQQAEAFGATFQFATVTDINSDEAIKKITTDKGEFQALAVILALGANPRKLGFQGEEEYQGRGVAYCATCDGEFFKDMVVYVVGGGFAAVEEGIFLTKYASHVHMVVRKDQFSCAKTVADKALSHPKITVHFETEVDRVEGTHCLNSITLLDKKTNSTQTVTEEDGMGVFVFAGYVPNTGWLPSSITLEDGYIVTTPEGETSVEGIYAAGDVRIKKLRQVVTAVSDGAAAATSLEKYVEKLHHDLDIPEFEVAVPKHVAAPVSHGSSHGETVEDGKFIDDDILAQLQPVLDRFEDTILVKGYFGTNDMAGELSSFLDDLSKISPKIKCDSTQTEESISYLALCKEDGTSVGVKYQAIPGGHEFTSFIVGLFYLSGAGTPLEEDIFARIQGLQPVNLTVCITLACTMCPDVVQACQRMALVNPSISTTIVDIMHAPEVKEKYKIMSVPCMLVNNEEVHFGKKSLEDILDILEK